MKHAASRKSARKKRSASAPSTSGSTPRRRLVPLLGSTAVVVLAAGALLFWNHQRHSSAFPAFVKTPHQNILLITIDTTRADVMSCYGGPARTPNLDRLANDGVRFRFAHAQSVLTLVSHTNILTGEYPYQHGVRDNAGFRLAPGSTTIATLLHARGMPTAAFVGAFPLNRQFGLAQGFDVYNDVSARDSLAADFALPERRAGEVVSLATAWIQAQRSPWFEWVHVFDPHAPYSPPPPFDAEYASNPYAGEVAYVDSALAPLLALARQQSIPTTIIVTGDHGESLGEHGEQTHGLFAYEATLHIPLILAQVGGGIPEKPAGVTSDVPVRHVDILPTVADVLQFAPPKGLPGRTLLTASNGEKEPRPSYFEAMTAMLKRGWAPLNGVLEGREKYIDLPIDELYHLDRDPRETNNVAPSEPANVRVLMELLRGFHAALPGDQVTESSDVRRQLAALGYVSGSAPRKKEYTTADDPKNLIDVDRLMMDGIQMYRDHKSAQAIDDYRQVIARRPDMGLAYRRLAFLLWDQGKINDAIDILRQALARNGPDVDIDVRLGTYLAESGNDREAIPMLERAVKADPQDMDGLNGLGIAYAQAGRADAAIATFKRILAASPRDPYALENIGTVDLQRGDTAAAEESFEAALQSDPKSSRAHAGLGVIALRAGRQDEAFADWKAAVQTDPHNFDALFDLASELLRAGRVDEARPYVEQFVATAPPALYGPDIDRLKRVLR